MQQRLILKALRKSKWNLGESILLNFDGGTMTLNHYKQVIENLRISLEFKKII
jgi:hypothetical protein